MTGKPRTAVDRRRELLVWAALAAWLAGMCALAMAATVVLTVAGRTRPAPVVIACSDRPGPTFASPAVFFSVPFSPQDCGAFTE